MIKHDEFCQLTMGLLDEFKHLAIFYLESLPEKLKQEIRENVNSITHGCASFGNGQYHYSSREITIGWTPNSTYFLELLGHEIAHAVNVEEKFGYLVRGDLQKSHLLCDEFSRYLLYGKSKYSSEFERVYGERDPDILEKLQREIKRNDGRIKKSEKLISRLFNEDTRFLR